MGSRWPARTWALELGLALLAAVLGGGLLALANAEAQPGEMPSLTGQLIVGGLSLVGLVLFRRRRPVALTVVLVPLGLMWVVPMGPTMVALFAVAVHRPWRTTFAVTALQIVVLVGVYRVAITDDREYLEALIVFVPVHLALVATGMLVRSQRQLVRSAEARARQAEEGQRMRVEEARHAERERLAREMHDVLAHRISLLAVHAGALAVRRDATGAERQAAEVIRQSAHEALEDLRQVIGMLRAEPDDPEAQRPQPTLADLPALVEQCRRAGTRITVQDRLAGSADVPARVGRHLYRIVQEALTNARKHAPQAPVRLVLAAEDGGVAVEVSNPAPAIAGPAIPGGGTGVRGAGPVIPGAGVGLIGLRERVAVAGGRLEHGPTAGGEFRVRAWLPLPT